MDHIVVFNKQLGDAVLLEPALHRLYTSSGRKVRLVGRSRLEPLIQLMPHVEYGGGLGFLRAGRLWCYDTSTRAALQSLTCLAGQKQILTADQDSLGPLHRLAFGNIICDPVGDSYMARYYWEHTTVENGGPFRPPRLSAPPKAWAPAGPVLAGCAVINPTSAWQRKSYPPKQWAEVIRGLVAGGVKPLVLAGGNEPWQIEHCRQITSMVSASDLHDLSGRTELESYLHLIAGARLVITIDGSASHFAQAYDRDSVTLFGPTVARWWHLSSPRHICLVAENFSGRPESPTSEIPSARVTETALQLWSTGRTT
jgi:ADP-heptose:LPS heptosyltransferase